MPELLPSRQGLLHLQRNPQHQHLLSSLSLSLHIRDRMLQTQSLQCCHQLYGPGQVSNQVSPAPHSSPTSTAPLPSLPPMRLQSDSHTSLSGETVQEEEAASAATRSGTRSDKMDIEEAVDDKTEETEDEEKAAPRIIPGSSAKIGTKFWNHIFIFLQRFSRHICFVS